MAAVALPAEKLKTEESAKLEAAVKAEETVETKADVQKRGLSGGLGYGHGGSSGKQIT